MYYCTQPIFLRLSLQERPVSKNSFTHSISEILSKFLYFGIKRHDLILQNLYIFHFLFNLIGHFLGAFLSFDTASWKFSIFLNFVAEFTFYLVDLQSAEMLQQYFHTKKIEMLYQH